MIPTFSSFPAWFDFVQFSRPSLFVPSFRLIHVKSRGKWKNLVFCQEGTMTNYTSELIVNEVLLAMDSNSLLDVESAVQKIQLFCQKGSISEAEIREALIKAAVQRGAGLMLVHSD
jgi:DNA polymerase III delta subunit